MSNDHAFRRYHRTTVVGLSGSSEYHPAARPSVDLDQQGGHQPDVPYGSCFSNSPLPCKPSPIYPLPPMITGREIQDLETREIVEKMSALAWHESHSWERGLYDDAGPGYLPEFDRNAGRRIGASPTTVADQNVWAVFRHEPAIESFQFPPNRIRVGGIECLRGDVD